MDKKIIILSRVSTDQQSLEAQTTELKNQAIRLGYPEQNHIIIEQVESAIKLTEEERVGLQRMKYYIENDNVDCVICWEPSRLSRRQTVLYSIRDYLLEHKVQLYILNPFVKLLNDDRTKLDTTASIVFSLFATISENEMTLKKERFKRAIVEMTKEGKKSRGATIFGYIKNKEKKMELHPENAKIVAEIFEYYAKENDASLYSTYVWLSSKYPTKFPILPYKKAQHKIRHFFEVEVYWKGNWCYPNIVSEELYNKVKEKMSKARCVPRFESKHNWLGRGRFYCKHCGHTLIPVGGATNAYYCTTDKEHNMTLNIDALEWLIWEEARVVANIKSITSNASNILEIKENISNKDNMKEQYDNKIKEIEGKKNKLVGLYLEGVITKEIFDLQNKGITDEIKIWQTKLNNINAELLELNALLDNTQNIIDIKPINYDEVDNFETKLEIVRECIDKVYVEKVENKVYELEFTYKGVIVPQPGKYMYISKNQFKKIWRINQDETEDLIYNETAHPMKRDEHGNFIK